MELCVVGAGYVGLTLAACLARLGHRVVCVEKDPERLEVVRSGACPFYEPGLAELLREGMQQGRLAFTGDLGEAAGGAEVVFCAVGTPSGRNGEADLSALEEVVDGLARLRDGERIVAIKSTVPVGTTDRVARRLRPNGAPVACTPEFLREGSAVRDFFRPHRTVIGTRSSLAAERLKGLFAPLGAPVLLTDPPTAEMIKYAANAFLATKISFINEIANLCEHVGADLRTVAEGLGLDPRIGPQYLRAGIGFGGSCLPKDVRALVELGREYLVEPVLLEAVLRVNESQRRRFVDRVEVLLGGLVGKTVAVLGLAFKAGTDDVRESPALAIAERLLARGASVQAHDPVASEAARRRLPALACFPNPYEAASGADAVLLLTEWPEYVELDWHEIRRRVRSPLVVDGRGMGLARRLVAAGFQVFEPGAPWRGRYGGGPEEAEWLT
ncbi:MAG: UDP-glucose/GDP-mannose dehydrogenase family protein [Armatimonadota bacterium]|nr:UDP-glucose/GDP-mannose dehydrogenase family protein [Armatimonadota bacterium]MDR7443545.1 UDP-glucose/GDP-mannose dehydrogenase family protein [Armatimonadota bacterium]MDR7570959.1 UDP-glucose/GDP-mannose dehydrogenase family protein [Armatimonadota bacterium]MDR7615043.1 UDP-glucose/GDP-mannose dehydrogenase family protein [Armatimonadota bacterium]